MQFFILRHEVLLLHTYISGVASWNLTCGNKEKSLGAKSGLYGGWRINLTFWPVNKVLIWAEVWKHGIAMVNNDSSSLVRFSNFSEDFRQTNCGIPLRIDRHMTSFAKQASNFRSWFFHKQLSLDLARVQRPTWWTVALFRAHTHTSMIRYL